MTSRIASLLLMLALSGAASSESLRGTVRQLSQAWDRDLEETSLQLQEAWDRELDEATDRTVMDFGTDVPIETGSSAPSAILIETESSVPTAILLATDTPTESPIAAMPEVIETEAPAETGAPTGAPTFVEVVTNAPTVSPVVTDSPTEAPEVSDAPTAVSFDEVVSDAPTGSPVGTDAPTDAPTEAAVVTFAPTETEEVAPAATPVAAPVATPVAAPVATPVATPVAAPVATPVASPVATPVTTPVASPVAAPVPPLTGSGGGAIPPQNKGKDPSFVVKSSMEFVFFEGQGRNPTNSEIEVFTRNAKKVYTTKLSQCYPSTFEEDQDVDETVEYDDATNTLTIHFKINVFLADKKDETEHLVAKCISDADWHNYIKLLKAEDSWGISEVTYKATGKGRRLL